MIKNTSKADAKYLAVQNLNAPSLDDVGNVRAAVEANSKTPTYGPFRVKEDGNGFLFLSSKLVDKRQAPSAYTASAAGKDRDMAHDFLKAMCDVISGDTHNSDQVVKASDELALHIHNTQPKRGAQRTVDDTPLFRQKLIALDEARIGQNGAKELEARSENRKTTLETFRSPLPPENPLQIKYVDIDLEEHTLDCTSGVKDDVATYTPPPQGKRKLLQHRRQAPTSPAPDTSVNVDKAVSGYVASTALRQLSIDTVRRLATKSTLTDAEELQLTVARSYLDETAPASKPWDPMTEIRLDTDLPPGYLPPKD